MMPKERKEVVGVINHSESFLLFVAIKICLGLRQIIAPENLCFRMKNDLTSTIGATGQIKTFFLLSSFLLNEFFNDLCNL